MKEFIDRTTWERNGNLTFFEGFLNPFISFTSEVECSSARQRARERSESFFLYYLYAVLRAANNVKELRYRFWGADDQVVLYDKVDILAPIKLKTRNAFFTVRIPYDENFRKFYAAARAIIEAVPEDGDPYGAENEMLSEQFPDHDVILLSAMPNFHFTSVTCAQKHKNGTDYPLLNAGKAIEKDGGLYMPVAICFHHGFADGGHIEQFFRLTQQFLAEL